MLARDGFIGKHNAVGAPQINVDVTSFKPLDYAAYNVAFSVFELGHNWLPLGLSQALENGLFGRLRRNPAKICLFRQRKFQFITKFGIGLNF